jgi:hypothetical protein
MKDLTNIVCAANNNSIKNPDHPTAKVFWDYGKIFTSMVMNSSYLRDVKNPIKRNMEIRFYEES